MELTLCSIFPCADARRQPTVRACRPIDEKCYSESVTVVDPASRKYRINTYGIGIYVNARYRVRTCDPYSVKVVLYH
jgi:hypothetical protein